MGRERVVGIAVRRWASRAALAAAVLLTALHAAGVWSDRSGGLVRVQQVFGSPWWPATAIGLLTVAPFLGPAGERRGWRTAACVALGLTLCLALLVILAERELRFPPRQVAASAPQGRADRRVVAAYDGGEDPVWSVTLFTGSGWSERRWDLGNFRVGDEGGPGGDPVAWRGPDAFTVTVRGTRTLVRLDPASGRPLDAPHR
ncbi:hypothetical protein [Kitasatospora paranensis]|uniref:Uncharacterized protein n=1 Tax=Kitasatospora paranensis TaxID=258053 RepID=A0ABW2FUZ5_9ACTN